MTSPTTNTNLVYKFTGTPPQTQNFGVIGDTEVLNQAIQDNYVSNRINASKDANPLATLGATGALWYAIAQGMDRFNANCAGPYEKTIFGKLGSWGDKFTENTFVGKKLNQFINWLGKYAEKKAESSQIAYTLRNHSTRPEWSMARNMSSGLLGFLSNDTEEIMGKFMDPVKSAQKLEQYGLSQENIDKIASSLKELKKEDKMLILVKEELKQLGAKPEIIKKFESKNGLYGLQKLANCLKARKLGFKNLVHYERLKGKFLENPHEVLKVLENGAKNGTKISIWKRGNKVLDHLFGRNASISEYLNKYKATLGTSNKTPLGRFMAKIMGYLAEGATNRFAGGKLAALMQAYVLGDMLVHTWLAPKGEKGKTFAERFVNDFTYFLAIPVGVWAMHKLGGFKYIGMNKDDVEKYRTALKTFNANVKKHKYATKEAYLAAKADLKTMLGLDKIKNPIKKLLQKVASFLNIGNESIQPYLSKNKFNFNWMKKFFNGNLIGVPMRVIFAMMVLSPLMAKATTKVAHAIFGRPTFSVLDEGNELSEEPPQTSIPQAQPNISQSQLSPQNQSKTNLLNKYKPA